MTPTTTTTKTTRSSLNGVVFPVAMKDVYYHVQGYKDMVKAEDKKAIVKEKEGTILSIVSNKYKFIPHVDIIKSMRSALDSQKLTYQEQVLLFKEGARMEVVYSIPSVSVSIGSSDKLWMQIRGRNSYDGKWNWGMLLGSFRLVCSNGARAGHIFFNMSGRHIGEVEPTFKIKENLPRLVEAWKGLGQTWQAWADTKLTDAQVEKMIESLDWPKKFKEMAKEETSAKSFDNSKWSAYNVLTRITTHEMKSTRRALVLEERANEIFYPTREVVDLVSAK